MKVKLNRLFQTILKSQEHSLKIQSIRSAVWIILGKGGGHFLKMLGSVVLTRILFPEAFGLMATATVALTMANLFSDTGVKTAIIQNPRGAEPEFLNTAWIISICRGIVLWIILSGLAIPLSKFYEAEKLAVIVFIMALYPLIMGFENPALTLFIKRFKLEKRVSFELFIQLIGLTSTICLTYVYHSVYAMAVGVPLSAFYRALGSYFIVRYRPRLRWNRQAGSALFHFGKFIFLNTMMTWAAYSSDILLVGRFLDMDTLGFYNLGKNLGYLIITFSLLVVAQAYLPAVSSVSNNLPRVIKIYRRSIALLLTLAIPISMVMAVFSQDIIRILYDPRYQPAYISMFWICLFGIFRIAGSVTGMTFIGLGKPVFETYSMAFGVIASFTCVLTGIHIGGLSGASMGMAWSLCLTALVQSIFLRVKMNFPLTIVIRPWFQSMIIISLTLVFYLFLRQRLVMDTLYNIPLIIAIGLFSMTIAGGVYFLLEGSRPFSDEGEIQNMGFFRLLS